jgi:protease-4
MREDEKDLFQELANNVLSQFKKAVVDSRKLAPELVDQIADGRVFTGEQAVKLGLADGFATVDEAISFAAEQAGLQQGKYKIFEPPKDRRGIFDKILGEGDDDLYSSKVAPAFEKFFKTQMLNQPLYLMPGSWL